MSDGTMLHYTTHKKVVPYAVLLLFIYFGAWNHCSQYFDLNIKYYAECSPVRNNA